MDKEHKSDRKKEESELQSEKELNEITTLQIFGVGMAGLSIAGLGVYLFYLSLFVEDNLWYQIVGVVFLFAGAGLLKSLEYYGGNNEVIEQEHENEHVFKGQISSISEKRQNVLDDEATPMCPKCSSPHIVANKKGYGFIKGAAGLFTVGPLGLMGGFVGSRKLQLACLTCGNRWNLKKSV